MSNSNSESGAVGTLPELETAQLVQQDPLAALQEETLSDLGADLEKAIAASDQEVIDAEIAEIMVRDLQRLAGQYIWACMVERLSETGAMPELGNGVTEEIVGQKEQLRSRIMKLVEAHGTNLSAEAQIVHDFYNKVTYRESSEMNPATYANFRHLIEQRQQLMSRREKAKQLFAGLAKMDLAVTVPGLSQLEQNVLDGDSAMATDAKRIQRHMLHIWSNSSVRMAYMREKHLEYIADMQRNRPIVEGPTTTARLNETHAKLYGRAAYKTAGPGFTGPPGWGKTSLLQDYYRHFGYEAASIDISPGMSEFTLMARPTLGMEESIIQKKSLLDTCEALTGAQLVRFCKEQTAYCESAGVTADMVTKLDNDDEGGKDELERKIRQRLVGGLHQSFNSDLAKILKAHTESRGFTYGPVLQALIDGRPVVLNEFPELQEWTFMHNLLTAIPATDEEAGPMPTSSPEEGKPIRAPKGWYYDTITGRYIRVPAHFSISPTGNIGPEYGNTGTSPAFLDRFGSNLVNVDGMPWNEVAQTIAWPRLSAGDGQFLLDNTTAYRLHFLITDVLPRLRERLRTDFSSGEQRDLISARAVIDLTEAMNPQKNRYPADLDTAIIKALIQPVKARRLDDAVEKIVAILVGTGFLTSDSAKALLATVVPEVESEKLKELIAEIKDPFNLEQYNESEDTYEGDCLVCGVNKCPCHGEETKQFIEQIEKASVLSKLGLSTELVKVLDSRLDEFAASEQWHIFLEGYFGSGDTSNTSLDEGRRGAIEKYLSKLFLDCEETPSTASSNLPIIAKGLSQMLVQRDGNATNEFITAVSTYWIQAIRDTASKVEKIRGGESLGRRDHDNIRAVVDDELQSALETMMYFQQIIPNNALPAEVDSMLAEMLETYGNSKTLWLASQLRTKGSALTTAIATATTNRKAELQKELQLAQQSVMGANTAGDSTDNEDDEKDSSKKKRRPQGKVPAAIMAISGFEQDYIKILRSLETLQHLTELKVIQLEEGADIMVNAERAIKKSSDEGHLPKAITPYIRVIRLLSSIRGLALDSALASLQETKVPDLPVLRNY